MKKLKAIIISLLIFVMVQPASLAAPRIPVYKVGDVLYFLDKATGTITGFAGEPRDLVIPLNLGGYKVVSIGPRAFAGSGTLRTLSIPDGISTVSAEAFASCPNLTSVEIGATVSYIGSCAFANCTSLSNVIFKGFLDNIESDSFTNTAWITSSSAEFVILGTATLLRYNGSSPTVTVPEGVRSIAANAFSYNPYVREIILPEGLEAIGDNAFVHCYSLEKIHIPSSVSHVGAGAFDDTIWMYNQEDDFVSVNGILIAYKGGDTHISVPETVTAIGSGAFMANDNLFSVHLPTSIVYIDSMAFGGCESLLAINIPDSVEWIDEYAFAGCGKLTLYGNPNSYAQSYALYMEMPLSAEVYVSFNGNPVYFNSAVPIIYYERTYLPLRAIMEMMDFTVSWDSATGIVSCTRDGRAVTVSPSGEIVVNGTVSPTVAPPVNIRGTNLVSARVIAEAVGADIVWNEALRTVEINF